jgi:hypothetical protein
LPVGVRRRLALLGSGLPLETCWAKDRIKGGPKAQNGMYGGQAIAAHQRGAFSLRQNYF